MKMQQHHWRVIALSLILITMLACAFPSQARQPLMSTSTPTPTPSALLNSGGEGGNNQGGNGTGNGQAGNSAGNNQGGNGGTNNGASTPVPTPNLPPTAQEPYVVKQIESLGHETISGKVCSLTQAFIVNAAAPEVAWTFNFVPEAAEQGKFTYAYFIPKAGESHDAAGSYTVTPAGADGTLLLSLTGSDHVVFKGFDGKLPINYKFNLVPSAATTCPNN